MFQQILNIYIDPEVEYNNSTTYRCYPQGSLPEFEEKLGVPLRATLGMQLIYNKLHMKYKSIAFISPYNMMTNAPFPALKCVLAPCDGNLEKIKGKPSIKTEYGLLMFDGVDKVRYGSIQKGKPIGEISKLDCLNSSYGVIMTLYKELNGEILYIPDLYYGIKLYE